MAKLSITYSAFSAMIQPTATREMRARAAVSARKTAKGSSNAPTARMNAASSPSIGASASTISRSRSARPATEAASNQRALRSSEALAPLSENPAARGRFQYYRDAVFVDSAAAALARFRRAEPCASLPIVIEGMPPPQDRGPSCVEVPAQHDFRIESRLATAADMRLEVHTDAPGWLFVADSWYPGWRARVNGEDRTVYPAQLTGKAVRLDAGLNRVRLRYAPLSFRIGAYISLATVLAFALIALRARLRRGNVQEATA